MVKRAQNEAFTIYESWNVALPRFSPRSRLHSLQPQGTGTALIECLTSYVARLAASHGVSPSALLSSTVAPVIGKNYWLQGGARDGTTGSALSKSFNIHTRAINGIGVIASDWVQTLQTLTLRNDLAQLTMLRWQSVFSHRNLLQPTRAWCPACYEDWASNDQPIYEPLLWTFRDVEVCLLHERRLRSACHNCNRTLQWLPRLARPGYCDKCNVWLGNRAEIKDDSVTTEELQWQSWVVSNLQEIVIARNHLPTPPTEKIAEALTLCIDSASDGVMNRFSSLIGKPKNTVWGWLQGNSLIPLNDLLRLCYFINLRLVDFLYTDQFVVPSADPIAQAEFTGNRPLQRRESPKSFDIFAIEHLLTAALIAHPPKPMTEVAIELRTHKRILYKHFPNLCKKISERHKKYRIKREEMIRESKSETLVQIRKQLSRNGIYPSRRRINKLASSPLIFLRESIFSGEKIWQPDCERG